MGPRTAGFLFGSFVSIVATSVFLKYDSLRTKDLTDAQVHKLETHAQLLERRLDVVRYGFKLVGGG
ncbi:hypothetical protein AGDE_02411 [Angomonas deanei]|uniref:Uncharacterized protein n=1 Tax=Angomonas deanei TaxID=59799 RepID=A0A7G2CM72_9TRYP|nr:hypothetical protein AGDE_02411 [Angomonas deanei]CAD2220157.1 hypothetical protein, conserved [Angomonas deanei]|eukprot:EPY41513.1 hypothetical protein AGDE_02411 [Angomonas deanei]